ncbi:hypothetical protein Lal_00010076 [Lupinus albus]|nr:hypothetical protein Lal_00010076 [Lupinus albus]
MSFNLFTKASRQNQSRFSFLLSRSFSHRSESSKHSFGIAFDIDGVILLGNTPVGGSPSALSRLYDAAGKLRIPYVFLTNGGGFPEAKRAFELSQLLGINISPSQVIAHPAHPNQQIKGVSIKGAHPSRSPCSLFENEFNTTITRFFYLRFENEFIVAVGKGQPAAVMSEYGFKNVLSIDEYASLFENIDPLAPYKKWTTKLAAVQNAEFNEGAPRNDVFSERIKAAFIVSDPVDWSRDIQVLCDILKTGGLPGRNVGPQPHLYFANDDLEYQECSPCRIHHHPLEYASFGKPHPSVFKNAEIVIQQLVPQIHGDPYNNAQNLKTLYMIGDNPVVDIRGARQTGHPWFSILTRTGVFKGKGNHDKFPADLVVDTVEEAVDYILTKECAS